AAAVKCGAQTIVTFNLKHFRDEHLAVWGIEAQSPDDFLLHQYHLDPQTTLRKLCIQAVRIGWDVRKLTGKLAPARPGIRQDRAAGFAGTGARLNA
ncbi:MAG TPA: hypothetical protein VME43_04460, partial [Bryobacteraceae bacterium]|nr:hypothetical protein [Bryobacteraceae bacterium]